MRHIAVLAIIVACYCGILSAAKPMETLERYNVVLVHGAAPEDQGFGSECNGTIHDAYAIASNNITKSDSTIGSRLGSAIGMLGDYDRTFNPNKDEDYNKKSAKKLTFWLDSAVFEDYQYRNGEIFMDSVNVFSSPYIYLQRAFTNPAESPAHNAHEIGDRTWKGNNKCSVRRSLIEEAQEVRAGGQNRLQQLRTNGVDEYRTIPSRNILIAHSMGGVASHEYVTDTSVYNDDVDKVITLDSPHEGTGSLNMLLDMRDYLRQYAEAQTQYMLMSILGMSYCAIAKEPYTAKIALWLLAPSLGASTIERFVTFFVDIKKLKDEYGFKAEDPLTSYIEPEAPGISALINRPFNENMPMIRLLAGKGGLTFSDPNKGARNFLNIFIPEGVSTSVMNMIEQLEGDGSASAIYTNVVTGLALGVFGGIALQDVGTTLVPEWSSLADSTIAFKDPNADVRKFTYDAAMNANSKSATKKALRNVAEITGVVSGIIAADIALSAYPIIQFATKVAIATAGATLFGYDLAETGVSDLIDSHENAKARRMLDTLYSAEFSYSKADGDNESGKIRLMEDFLYERPFVNLALSLSDSVLRSVDPGCYYEADDASKQQLCEVGLYGSRDSIVVNTHVIGDSTGAGKDSVWYDTTHVYNAVAERLDSIGNVVRDSSGKVVYDSVYYGTFEQRNYSDFRKSPLKFKSESDWYKVGVKVDRWERVDGLKPNGDLAPKGVPIRHVERYSVPDIVVDGFIEKYSFVVDDLMPHRMRQIKMTFNSNEEVAWECDITKAEDDATACDVYRRLIGNAWERIVFSDSVEVTDSLGVVHKVLKSDTLKTVKHPIKKNGRFDFEARKYFGNLANIQKDNQNTVMISMVNKIGLSNTQRFYYLFKATANMLKPTWPQHDVVLNAIDGFRAYVSALDYQGFSVHNASDAIFFDPLGTASQVGDTLPMVMTEFQGTNAEGKDTSSAVFASNQNVSKPVEGKYRWVVYASVSNTANTNKTDSYEVHFTVDRTAPAFTLTSDAMMNPDSSMFITRFKWAGKDSADNANGSDIRAMRWTLEKATGQLSGGSATSFTKYAELPALYDVASNEFAIAWDKVPQGKRDSMENGLYRIAAHAIDYAVPNLDAYHKVNALVDSIFSNPTNLSDSLWTRIGSLGLNDTTIYAEFRVDTAAPVFTFHETRAVTAADTVNYGTYVNLSGKYDTLRKNAPARDSSWTYISKDSLLQIGYTIMDTLNGLDSAAVTVGWSFVHLPDTNVIDRAGDSVWVFDSLGGKSSGTWTEMAGLRMADGEYSVRAVLRDAAKNVRHDVVPKRVRVDRTAPQIVGLTSNHLVYMNTDGDFSETILVSESGDVGVNRTGMHCSYRVLGGSDTSWHEIRKDGRKLLSEDSVMFVIDKSAVDTSRGTRYLEAACVDAAGNVSVRTDLFHVGARFPQITYPLPDSIQSDLEFIPIVGIAPYASSADSLSSVYRLRYRTGNDTTWRTDKVKVVAANRSTGADNVSRVSQNVEGVLGYLRNEGFGSEEKITVELAIASCETCDDWAAVTTNFVVIPPDTNYSKPAVEFAVTRNGSDVTTFKTDDGPVDISVRLKNKFNGNYMLRVYAEDSKHRGIFDASREKVFYNPYYGTPTASADTAIWFYEKDGKYHLAWKNLDKINLKVGYNSAKFGETCKSADANQSLADGCLTELSPIDFSSIANAMNAYLADYPEWMPPAYIDSTMTITKDSGEVVLESSEAFRVYVERKDATDTTTLNVPVYFGESTKPGFYWVEHVDSLVSPLMTGWTVNPNAYGFDYRWNGIATSGAYPSGDITLYAEVTENILDNPFVSVVTKTLKVEQKKAELVVRDTLPDYVLLMKAGSGTSSAGTSDTPVYELDSMKVYFGLKNSDARVRISVLGSAKSMVIFDDVLRAHSGDSAYSVKWLGTDSSGLPLLSEGKCYLKFEAMLLNTDSVVSSISVPFEYKLGPSMKDMTPDDPKESNESRFFVAEAKKKDDRYVYEPYADYLVVANMSGWYLPDSLRNKTYNVKGTVEGSQEILGFSPERFSLGIKRHRDTLEMVIVSKLHNRMVNLDDCNGLWTSCENITVEEFDDYKIDTAVFYKTSRTKLIVFDHGHDNYGFVQFDSTTAYLDVVACSKKLWSEYGKNIRTKDNITREKFEELKQKCEWSIKNVLDSDLGYYSIPDPGRCIELETMRTYPESVYIEAHNNCNVDIVDLLTLPKHIDSCLANYFCPSKNFEPVYRMAEKDVGCSIDSTSGYLDSICETGNKKYDPNLRLFNVTFTPSPATNRFYRDWAMITDYNSARFWAREHFSMTLEIPDSYWNAPFGMDNLVNRTIRFDHTNETIFNENDDDGYWNAVKGNGKDSNAIDTSIGNYFDGNEWQFNQKYGLLTPFEVQRLIFYPVDIYADGSNVFRFDDESKDFMFSSSYELKFYGKDDTTHHFVAKVIGDLIDPSSNSGCEVDTTKFVMRTGAKNPCQINLSSTTHDTVKTPTFRHGNVHFFVGMNQTWAQADNGHRPSVAYPAADTASWRNSIKDGCSDSTTWEDYKMFAAEGKEDKTCYKYYGSGSKIHFYFNDYGKNDSLWKVFFLTDTTHYIRNYVNSPDYYYRPKFVDSMMVINKASLGENDFSLSYKVNPLNFEHIGESDSVRFFIRMDSLNKIKSEYGGARITLSKLNVNMEELKGDSLKFDGDSTLYVPTQRWTDTLAYRRSYDTDKKVLERSGENISLRDIYTYRANPDANSCGKALFCVDTAHPQSELIRNPWIINPVVESSSLLQTDFSMHPFLEVSGNRDSLDRHVAFKGAIPPRPPEIVEIRGKLTPNQTYSLSYLNNSTYYSITDTLKVASDCEKYMDGTCHLAWFDVNRLQGHTQFLLTWDGDGSDATVNPTNVMHFNMYVGSNVKPGNNGVVKSMYGELTVSFPQGSLENADDFTVRTVNVQKDYGFGVFKNMALTGPVMEVLPSMTFNDTTKLPRIQMQISRQEMIDMNVTPQTLRLYKVDFDRKEFVPLEKSLYGFLDAQGAPVMDVNGTDTLECHSVGETNPRCTDEKLAWDYVLISAETKTFSVFVTMDTLAASMRYMGLEVLPAVAKTSEREVRVDGVGLFNLYVDDDSLWNDSTDLTPMAQLPFTLDSNGIAHVTLPTRAAEIDTNYVFAFAMADTAEMFAPAVAKALTVPAQFACHVPSDSLWMGIDNGYLAYGAWCNHPGYGTLSLYRDNSLVAEIRGEIPDTIRYDGKRLVGGSVVGTVAPGRYESRYVGVSVLGEDAQLAGPAVRTDSARPVMSSFEVLSGEDALDRIFTVNANVRDVESGVAQVVVSTKLGGASRTPLVLLPDSLGNVTGVVRLTRSELARCSGCKLSLEMRAEDYGHNHVERTYESGKLYQYPTELALWYPSREGSGKLAYEYVGTGHHMNLDSVKSPWSGDAGIYFSALDDRASGVVPSAGHVSLGTSSSYSFETRIKVGYSGAAGWHRVLGFKGVGGLEMELLVHNRKLRLREGSRTWETPDNALPVAKDWAHVVVTVDSSEVNFYVNGEIMKSASAEPLERELDGIFSAGADGENSFVGHIADMRMYKKALSAGEVFALSQPVVDDKIVEPEIVEIVTVPMITVDGGNGFEPEFSCAVAGNRYLESTRDNARLTLNALIDKAATYKVMMYVRSAALQSANVSVSPSPGVRYAGNIPLSPVWRTVGVSDISMNLSAGMHTVTLEAPEGLQVAGFALVTANVSPASIAWNSGLENPERKIKTFVRYEGFADKKILQPRVRLRNVSNGQVRGYSVRYYFRGEESSMAKVHAYYPRDTVGLAVHSESAHTGFVEWKFANGVIPSGGTVFNGDGPHFGVHYEDWTPWNPYDDPSFVENASANFVEDNGIIVLDADKRLIGGSCVEMEDSISIEVKARVYAAETRNDNQASEIQMKVENVGNVTLKNYDVRYYFFLEGGLAPEFNAYVLPDGVTASVENIGDGRWQVAMHASKPLVPGGSWKDNAQFALHCENWNAIWNGLDDPSSIGLGWNMVEAVGVNVFDSLGNRIYGNEPVWPDIAGYVACNGCTADSSGTPDIGLTPKNDAIPIHRTDDGLVISLPQYTNISLSLVNVVGVPVRNLYSGTLAPGEQFIHVNWTGIDLNRTYLMLRVNGAIKSTKLLSLL